MNESDQVGKRSSIQEIEVNRSDVRRCYALALNPHFDDIIQLISDIEEMLGLKSDRSYREARLKELRLKAARENVDPELGNSLIREVDYYTRLLVKKKSILESIYSCCNDFCMTMKGELSNLEKRIQEDCEAGLPTYTYKRRFLPHTTIERGRRRNRLPNSALTVLWEFVRTHKNNPYPTVQQKEMLARQTRLTTTQIRNWFTNTRKRKLSQNAESDEEYTFDSESESSVATNTISITRSRRGRKKRLRANSSDEGQLVQPNGLDDKEDEKVVVEENRVGTWIQYHKNGLHPISQIAQVKEGENLSGFNMAFQEDLLIRAKEPHSLIAGNDPELKKAEGNTQFKTEEPNSEASESGATVLDGVPDSIIQL